MSEFRRSLMMGISDTPTPGGDKFEKIVEVLNNISGCKSFLRKFDDSQLVWVLTYASKSSTSHTLRIFDLNGNQLASIEHSGKRHYGVVKDNIACIYSGTADRKLPVSVFQYKNGTLSNIKTSPSIGNWANSYCSYMYYDNSNNLHYCGPSNSSRMCVFDYNITNNTVARTESKYDEFVQWYSYDSTYFRGILYAYENSVNELDARYVKKTSTTNNFPDSNYYPRLSGYITVGMIPLFDYTGSLRDLQYEIFASKKNGSIWKNMLGLDSLEPSNLSVGDIELPRNNNIFNFEYNGLSYVKDGVLHLYAYNFTTNKIEELI